MRFKHHWQKDSHVSLNSDKYKDWYRRVRLKNSMRLKPQQRLERVELEFCGSEALGPQVREKIGLEFWGGSCRSRD